MSTESRVIGTCALVVLGVGTANSLGKHQRLPTTRFLVGTAATFLILSALSEGEPDVAKALALAVTTTVVLGDGDGLFSYVNKHGEADTKASKPKNTHAPAGTGAQPIPVQSGEAPHPSNIYHLPNLAAIPNIGR